MAIYNQDSATMQSGITKEIDAAGMGMVFDVLQRMQYIYPIKSTVRELLSNAIDSVKEKNMAREILSGKAKVSDYYVEREGDLYKDSKFNPAYYDPQWFSEDDLIYMTYRSTALDKDEVIFEDHGVGLGGKRLEGYFKLAYSTKRLSKLPLGKWGLGAKSPLSTGAKYYTVESRYNGQLFRFQVYSNDFYSIIPQFDLESGKENEFVVFNADDPDERKRRKVYFEQTTLKNGLTITMEVKKHHKGQYLDAVKSQMLYFDNILPRVLKEDGNYEVIPYRANILYEDEMIVMSDNEYWSKPHILLNGVNYGHIDFKELELQDIQGNIGIKVQPEDVEVNTSREAILWTDMTKEKVLARFNEVVQIAAGMIQEELKHTDILKWIKTCYSISGRYAQRGGIVGRLAAIVDLSSVNVKFLPLQDTKYVFRQADPLPGIYMRRVYMEESVEKGVRKRKVNRYHMQNINEVVTGSPVILINQDTRISNRKDKYLLSLYPEGYILALEPPGTEEQRKELSEAMQDFYMRAAYSAPAWKMLWDYLTKAEGVLVYEQVEVPENFTGNDNEEEQEVTETEEEEELVRIARISAEERRKLEGKTIVQTPRLEQALRVKDAEDNWTDQLFEWQKMEVPLKSINDWHAEEAYYGNDTDADLFPLVAALTRDPHPANNRDNQRRKYAASYADWVNSKYYRLNKDFIETVKIADHQAFRCQHFFDASAILVKVSQNNSRYYRDFRHIREFFIQFKDKTTITMSNILVRWNTARLVREKLKDAAFLHNFEQFNPAFASAYNMLCNYVDQNYREVQEMAGKTYGISTEAYTDLISHLDKVYQFQSFVASGQSAEDIADMAQEFFGTRDLRNGMAVEPSIIRVLDDVSEYVQAVGPLLNWIPVLHGLGNSTAPVAYAPGAARSKPHIPDEVVYEIRSFLEYKGLLNYKTSLEIEIEEEMREIQSLGVPVKVLDEEEEVYKGGQEQAEDSEGHKLFIEY